MKQSGDDNRIVLVSGIGHQYHTIPFSVENITAKQYNKDSFPRFKYYHNSKLGLKIPKGQSEAVNRKIVVEKN
jgi:hypothetical protein